MVHMELYKTRVNLVEIQRATAELKVFIATLFVEIFSSCKHLEKVY
jgi:hypothetical protein